MTHPRLLLLGPPRLEVAGKRQDLRLDRPTSLLFYLAAKADWVSRDELAFLYRPDAPDEVALANIRKLLHRARKIPWAGNAAFDIEASRVRLIVASDLTSFREALARGDWRRAHDLYRGPLLEGLELRNAPGYNAWIELERQQLARSWRTATMRRAELLEQDNHHREALELFRAVLQRDPLDEGAVQGCLRNLAAGGHRPAALELYRDFRDHLARQLDLEPLESTTALLQAIQRQDEPSSKKSDAPRAPSRQPLPTPTSRFIGRQRELTHLAELLDDPDTRLVTLLGLGGVGKTRLALEIANRRQTAFTDGARFVSLADVTEAASLTSAIAAQLGIPVAEGERLEREMITFLRHKQLLLVLDNFEHLVDGAGVLVRILEGAPQLTILITSRTRLELSCETIVDLTGLDFPAANSDTPPEHFDAVTLFLSRARQGTVGFLPDREGLDAIAAITRQVEGLPLAVELAAAWMRSLQPRRLEEELRVSLDMLASSAYDLPERQRSIRVVLEHTWTHLSPREQAALTRLSVFHGGFSLDAAEAVADAHLPLLFNLINHSLVRWDRAGRYHLHELVRQYAAEHLADPDTIGRHADYYTGLLAAYRGDIKGGGQQRALARLEAEHENILQAWRTAARQRNFTALEGSHETLFYYLSLRGLMAAGREDFEAAVHSLRRERLPPDAGRVLAQLLTCLGYFQRNLAEVESANSSLQEALALVLALRDPGILNHVYFGLGQLSEYLGDFPQAKILYHQVLDGDPDDHLRASVHLGLGNLASYQGEEEQGEYHYQQSYQLFQQLGDLEGTRNALINLGATAFDRGDISQARCSWREAAELNAIFGNARREAVILNNLGSAAEAEGDLENAERYFRRSLELRWRVGDERGSANVLGNLARLAHNRGELETARRHYRRALDLYRELGDRSGITMSKSGFARTLLSSGQPSRAEQLAWEALTLAREGSVKTDLLSSTLTLAMTEAEHGRNAEALVLARLVARESETHSRALHQSARAMIAKLLPSDLPEMPEAGDLPPLEVVLDDLAQRRSE